MLRKKRFIMVKRGTKSYHKACRPMTLLLVLWSVRGCSASLDVDTYALAYGGNVSLTLYDPIYKWTRRSVLECAHQCSRDAPCVSFSWDRTSKACTTGRGVVLTTEASNNATSEIWYNVQDSGRCRFDLGYEFRSAKSQARCVFLSETEKNMDDAKRACLERGGRLVKANSLEIIDLILTLASDHEDYKPADSVFGGPFVGLDDVQEENQFVWSDGQQMTASEKGVLFSPSQPDNSGSGEDCVTLSLRQKRLNDIRCQQAARYVCERAP